MRKPTKSTTAAQLLARLQHDPRWLARHKLNEADRVAGQAASSAEQEALLRDLARVGWEVADVWELVNSKDRYKAAIPVLLEHIKKSYSVGVKEGIARALTVDFAAGAVTCNTLIGEYKKLNDNSENSLKWVLGNAISVVASPDCMSDVIDLLYDRANGRARDMMALRLPKLLPKPRAKIF